MHHKKEWFRQYALNDDACRERFPLRCPPWSVSANNERVYFQLGCLIDLVHLTADTLRDVVQLVPFVDRGHDRIDLKNRIIYCAMQLSRYWPDESKDDQTLYTNVLDTAQACTVIMEDLRDEIRAYAVGTNPDYIAERLNKDRDAILSALESVGCFRED